ncbi:MAG: DNA-directed polymerase subunit beta [Patescibacteria group bacterium]|nr:DNA-directed polymerase subunit beta [Patescibacteria group bacterium]
MKTINTKKFDTLTLKIASPEAIREWSYGEVTKPETINYRTGRSERHGLFDEKIFGPEKDYECYCGKYRRIRYKGIICEKCGVEVTQSIVRRERMGHIDLAVPVAHIWFLRNVPSRIAMILGASLSDVEKVIYFAGYIITSVNDTAREEVIRNLESEFKEKIKSAQDEKTRDRLMELMSNAKREIKEISPWKILDETVYHRYAMRYGTCFEARIGAEAIYDVFKGIDLDVLEKEVANMLEKSGSTDREKLEKRLSLVRAFRNADLRPEWMFLTALPIIPPGIRPMVALEGGRHATSDVNDLYRRVINRNNRLKKLLEIEAPDVILRNEKRILQEAVDALVDNSARHGDAAVALTGQKRVLKSLSDNLKGKTGILRGNLLGKRVDYSARSVIVVGPELSLDECGLPKHMAMELFKPFVISKLIEREFTFNIRGANKLIEDNVPEVWAILEEVIQGKYVLLNRAPTLHRLGIQAFKPKLIEGSAIQLHPLVCEAFNADFDGDQMAVHLPLSDEAQQEARELMAAHKNLLKPGSGDPITNPRMDMVLGSYWMTTIEEDAMGQGKYFPSPNEAITAQNFGIVDIRAKIMVMPTNTPKYEAYDGKVFETSVGRLLWNSVFPSDYPYMNYQVGKKEMNVIMEDVFAKFDAEEAPKIIDKIKTFGFKYAAKSGTTWNLTAVQEPKEKKALIEEGWKKIDKIEDDYSEGLLSQEEKHNKAIDTWKEIRKRLENILKDDIVTSSSSSVNDLIYSGARGSMSQLIQLAGMKGIMVNNSGGQMEYPVIGSNIVGFTPLEYFITTYGARKGNSDTALKTAQAGYLTRRLVDVAQDAIVTIEDCGTDKSKTFFRKDLFGNSISLLKFLRGRVLAKDVKVNDKVLQKGHLLSILEAQEIENDSSVQEVSVFTPLTCEAVHGVCRKCYGLDMGRNLFVRLGEAVGIVAAQAIGEPGTQLTMRTFHSGGVAGADITQGLPRVEEIFERRSPKSLAVVAHEDGEVYEVRKEKGEKAIIIMADEDAKGNKKGKMVEYSMGARRSALVKKGDRVKKGQILTDGSADIDEIFKYAGPEYAEEYIVNEILKVYELQGAAISRKHIEVIIKQMTSRIKITSPGDSRFSQGDLVELSAFREENENVKSSGGREAEGRNLILGVSEVSLTTTSWLSSASFQNTTKVLIGAATRGQTDTLKGLKENVILGRLIPAGTGIRGVDNN